MRMWGLLFPAMPENSQVHHAHADVGIARSFSGLCPNGTITPMRMWGLRYQLVTFHPMKLRPDHAHADVGIALENLAEIPLKPSRPRACGLLFRGKDSNGTKSDAGRITTETRSVISSINNI